MPARAAPRRAWALGRKGPGAAGAQERGGCPRPLGDVHSRPPGPPPLGQSATQRRSRGRSHLHWRRASCVPLYRPYPRLVEAAEATATPRMTRAPN